MHYDVIYIQDTSYRGLFDTFALVHEGEHEYCARISYTSSGCTCVVSLPDHPNDFVGLTSDLTHSSPLANKVELCYKTLTKRLVGEL